MVEFDIVDWVKIILCVKQALVKFFSASGWESLFIEVGDIPIGIDIFYPNIVVEVSTYDIFFNIRGFIRIFLYYY